MTFCTTCGAENRQTGRFCVRCGAQLTPAPGAWREGGNSGGAVDDYTTVVNSSSRDYTTPTYEAYQPLAAVEALRSGQTISSSFTCPYCRSTSPPLLKQRVSTAGWVTLIALLITCFPLFWIGLLIKQDYHVCRSCGITLD